MTDWKSELQSILDKHNRDHLRRNKIIAEKTREERAKALFLCFRQLREDGFKLDDPRNLKPKHVEHLAKRWSSEGLSASTIQSRLSNLRGFAAWIGKPGLVQEPESYLPRDIVRRRYAAQADKSWSPNGFDPEEIIRQVEAVDRHVAMQLRLVKVFGLRRKEAVMIKPSRADHGHYLNVTEGTKGGRGRIIPVVSAEQRQVLDAARAMAGSVDGHLGRPGKTLAQNLKRYTNVLARLGLTRAEAGVTGHGLRHEYANDRIEAITGEPSRIRGGKVDRETERAARLQVSEELGHAREQITNAYLGGLK